MILKALYDYYHRCGNLPPKGMELKQIGFIIVLDANGKFLRFEDRRIDKNRSQEFLVKKSIGRTSAPIANYLYDSCQYIFGYSEKDDDKALKCFEIFKAKIEEICMVHPDSQDLKAICKFYKNSRDDIIEILKKDSLWSEIERNLNKKFSLFTFLIEGDTKVVAEKQELLPLSEEDNISNNEALCLVTGNKSKITQITTATMIPGSQATAKLVSFQTKSGYDSYGKEQGGNAPIGEETEFAYTTALNHLLRNDSRNKFVVGNRTFVFWASNNNEVGRQAEEGLFSLFGFSDSIDNPNQGIEEVHKVFNAIYSGNLKTSSDDKFYILGLAPNSARIAVTYWAETPIKEFAERINRHFDDMSIVNTRKEQTPCMGLRSILSAVTLGGKQSDATPNLPEAVVKSIFQGLPYPQPLYSSCLRRIRAEQSITITRVAIIKAYLNRLNDNEQKIEVMLDKENTNQGYLCGRLFAVLDKIQYDANKQHSIKERYMNSASSTPAAVFSTILNLSAHHSEKLNEGSNIFYEKVKREIIDKISANGFPSHLDLQEQGRFFVGYYHQIQDLYTKKDEKTEE
jgi:CRISPR-associated protein Csd1